MTTIINVQYETYSATITDQDGQFFVDGLSNPNVVGRDFPDREIARYIAFLEVVCRRLRQAHLERELVFGRSAD